ncbi:hypothetical protein CRYPA_1484 [uncultured Candidatus Thioglobus sp.]|nr:hypothetical protein CRYPA_1484 [uncultured Candidatus Thioglobus sp.]
MSFYLDCFDKQTELIVLEYKLRNVTAKDLQDLMNVSEKRRKEDPEFINGWRNNRIYKNKISFFESLLQGRKIDLNKYIVQFSNLDDEGCEDEDVTFHEPPDWISKREINRMNHQLEEEKKKEEVFHKRITGRHPFITEINNQGQSVIKLNHSTPYKQH